MKLGLRTNVTQPRRASNGTGGDTTPGGSRHVYVRPGGADVYLRPDGTSVYLRP